MVKDLVTIFPVLKDWIMEFLASNDGMVATSTGHNNLIEQVGNFLTSELHIIFSSWFYFDSKGTHVPLSFLTSKE